MRPSGPSHPQELYVPVPINIEEFCPETITLTAAGVFDRIGAPCRHRYTARNASGNTYMLVISQLTEELTE